MYNIITYNPGWISKETFRTVDSAKEFISSQGGIGVTYYVVEINKVAAFEFKETRTLTIIQREV